LLSVLAVNFVIVPTNLYFIFLFSFIEHTNNVEFLELYFDCLSTKKKATFHSTSVTFHFFSSTTSSMPLEVLKPVRVVDAPLLTIDEYFGNVASADSGISACLAEVTGPTEEAYQTPEFDEYVIVLEGSVDIIQETGTDIKTTAVAAGQGIFLPKNTRVKWKWNGACKYVPICLPAFNPNNCHREEEAGCAKSDGAMDDLHKLHETAAKQSKPAAGSHFGSEFLVGSAVGLLVGFIAAKYAR
jgi:hypothetical protein